MTSNNLKNPPDRHDTHIEKQVINSATQDTDDKSITHKKNVKHNKKKNNSQEKISRQNDNRYFKYYYNIIYK